jgi:CHAT domain-containing protein/Tfp pilus assembly protein PilF
MPSARNLRRTLGVLISGLILLGLAGALFFRVRKEGATLPPKEPEAREEAIHYEGEVVRLEPNQAVTVENFVGGKGRRYEVLLAEGDFARLEVEQKGIDVNVLIHRPGKEKPLRVDSPNGRFGPEVVFQLAEQAGLHRFDVVCLDAATAPGNYDIVVKQRDQAEPADRAFYEAWKLFRNGELRRQNGPLAEAVGFFEQALDAWRRLDHPDWEAETLHRLGKVQDELGQAPAALEAFRAALPWFQKNGPRAYEAEVLNSIGRLLFRQGDQDGALRHAEEAREVAGQIDRRGLEAEALHTLATIRHRQGEFEKALELFQQARVLATQGDDPLTEVFILHGLGEFQLYLGRFDAARDSFKQALSREEKVGDPATRAELLRSMADLHRRNRDTELARKCLTESLALHRARGDRGSEAILLNSLGTLELDANRPEDARISYQNALELSRSSGNLYSEAFALLNLGRALYDSKDIQGALRLHEEAAALFRELEHRRGLVSTRYGSARALNALGRYAEAEEILEQVFADTEALRSGTTDTDLRSTFFATKQHYLDLYVDVLMNLHREHPDVGYDHLALQVNERRRARSLLEELGGTVKIRPDADPELVSRRDELQQAIEATESELGGVDAQRAEVLHQRLRSLLAELGQVRTALAKKAARQGSSAEPRPLGFKGIQELLDPETLLLVFSLGEERSYLWCVPHEGKIVSSVLPARSQIEDAVHQLTKAWSDQGRDRGRPERWAAQLSRDLFRDVADLLGTRRLVIVADGALQGLPFAALPDPASRAGGEPVPPLLARHEIVYLPSASVLAVLRRDLFNRTEAFNPLAIMAHPVFGPDDPRLHGKVPEIPAPTLDPELTRAARELGLESLHPLPFSEEEAKGICGIYPSDRCRIFSDFGADLEAVENGALSGYRIVHFATHGLMNPQHPELSGLVLSRVDQEGRSRRGFLQAHRIADLDLDAELVVLSACETGVGTDRRGEGMMALTRSFMRAGAPRVVVSLWKVSDQATAELMVRFYRGMEEHRLRPPEALRCAQLSMLGERRWSDPFYWAPFVVQGEWKKDVGEAPASSDDSIERQSGGTRIGGLPDDDFPPPGQEPPRRCPDLTRPARPGKGAP